MGRGVRPDLTRIGALTLRVLHVSPHPDDELVGAPATLMALRDAGHQVTNLALSLGRPADHDRRRAEVTEACRRAGFGLTVVEPPVPISAGDDLPASEVRIRALIEQALDGADAPDLVVGPGPHDVHHGHELAGRAIRDVLAARDDAPPWWIWAIWGDLPLPTMVTALDDERVGEITEALSAHAGEMERADHRVQVEARTRVAATLAAEKIFGFGAPALTADRAELVTEVVRRDGHWLLGSPRALDANQPLAGPRTLRVDDWLDAPSARDLVDGAVY